VDSTAYSKEKVTVNPRRKIDNVRMRIQHQQLLQHFAYEDISERALARAAGVSHTTIRNYLNGDSKTCNAATAKKIEKALAVPKGSIFVPELSTVESTVAA
jgi:transcriptional regulator with XRE-family HTH domain